VEGPLTTDKGEREWPQGDKEFRAVLHFKEEANLLRGFMGSTLSEKDTKYAAKKVLGGGSC